MIGRMVPIRKTTLRAYLLLACCALFAQPLLGALGDGFNLEMEAWRATDVVLVEITELGGSFEVVEIWKGNLTVGERISLQDLVPRAGAKPLSEYPTANPYESFDDHAIREQIPKQPKGSQMVLFLKRDSGSERRFQWKSAHEAGPMSWSAVWIEGGQLFSFQPTCNPCTPLLFHWGSKTEAELKERVEHITEVQQDFEQVLETTQGAQRAQMLEPFLKSGVWMARISAMDELEKTGKPAIPAVEAMLDDPTHDSDIWRLIHVLVGIGGESVGPFLNDHFEREVAFWESTANSIPRNWLVDGRHDNPLGQHHDVTESLIEALKTTHYEGALQPALRLHKLWISLPQLNDSAGARSVGEECEQLIVALQKQ